MLSYDNLEKAVMQFVMNSKQESFDAEELAADLDPQSAGEERENTIRRICNILDSCEFVARKHSSDLYYISTISSAEPRSSASRDRLSWNAESSSRRRVWNLSTRRNSMRMNSNSPAEKSPPRSN